MPPPLVPGQSQILLKSLIPGWAKDEPMLKSGFTLSSEVLAEPSCASDSNGRLGRLKRITLEFVLLSAELPQEPPPSPLKLNGMSGSFASTFL